ncbi:hypothetical protein [Bacillus sp. ISL-77]|uniref:hypothetical protein n=1 Tax=Bacillus sp. ISL-77 TaxID=2819138 RepID=UPI001BEAD97F|nr:hypothetical protein [Bacillus sp. ISL-77]MBT2740546.1 hypothetical protein [Bacillus sp. ISL-77]
MTKKKKIIGLFILAIMIGVTLFTVNVIREFKIMFHSMDINQGGFWDLKAQQYKESK